jgi:hypothetical protein
VEINPPHEGEDRRVAGMFVKDDAGRTYIAHSGKVGGGRKGIGQRAFREFFKNHPWPEIESRGGPRTVLILGPLDAPEFITQLSEFVHAVADFKSQAVT